ncbi:MAG: hypothetical protein D6E12_14680 [Desulfovibrio sp.]|nr:MAG: hypothetical protein D6E12_14680 [Desulfovibrio sp.]
METETVYSHHAPIAGERREQLKDRYPLKRLHGDDLLGVARYMKDRLGETRVVVDGEYVSDHAALAGMDLKKARWFSAECREQGIGIEIRPGWFVIELRESNDHDYRSLAYGLHDELDELILSRLERIRNRKRRIFQVVLFVQCSLLFGLACLLSFWTGLGMLVVGVLSHFFVDKLVSVILLGYIWGAILSLLMAALVGFLLAFWAIPVFFLASFAANAWIIEQSTREDV